MKISPIALLLVALTLGSVLPPQAAFITIDYSEIDTVTITAGDFEAGFSVTGTLLTTGLGDTGSVIFADGIIYSFSGSWIDLGLSPTDAVTQLFGVDDDAFSGVQVLGTTDGLFGSLEDQFNGFDPSLLGPFPNPGGCL
jgi:hypothetical protein